MTEYIKLEVPIEVRRTCRDLTGGLCWDAPPTDKSSYTITCCKKELEDLVALAIKALIMCELGCDGPTYESLNVRTTCSWISKPRPPVGRRLSSLVSRPRPEELKEEDPDPECGLCNGPCQLTTPLADDAERKRLFAMAYGKEEDEDVVVATTWECRVEERLNRLDALFYSRDVDKVIAAFSWEKEQAESIGTIAENELQNGLRIARLDERLREHEAAAEADAEACTEQELELDSLEERVARLEDLIEVALAGVSNLALNAGKDAEEGDALAIKVEDLSNAVRGLNGLQLEADERIDGIHEELNYSFGMHASDIALLAKRLNDLEAGAAETERYNEEIDRHNESVDALEPRVEELEEAVEDLQEALGPDWF